MNIYIYIHLFLFILCFKNNHINTKNNKNNKILQRKNSLKKIG